MSDHKDLFSNIFASLIVAVFTLVGTYIVSYFYIGGSVSLSRAEKDNSRITSITIENYTQHQSDFRIWLVGKTTRIFGSSGNASIKLEVEPYRTGQILSVTSIAANSSFTAMIEQDAAENYFDVEILQPESGFQLRDLSKPKRNIDYISPLVMAIFSFAVYFLINLHAARKAKNFFREINSLNKIVERSDKKIEELQKSIEKFRQTMQRNRLYMGKFNYYLQIENDFWKSCVKEIFRNANVSRDGSQTLLRAIAKKFGSATKPIDYRSQNLDEIIDILIDDVRREKFDDLSSDA